MYPNLNLVESENIVKMFHVNVYVDFCALASLAVPALLLAASGAAEAKWVPPSSTPGPLKRIAFVCE